MNTTQRYLYQRYILWILIEISIIVTDMQEVIGTAIAFTLLSNGKMPLWAGVLITIVDALTFLIMEKFGILTLEICFCTLVAIIGMTFGTEYILLAPNQGSVLYGIFVPQCTNCNAIVLMQAVGIIGAIIQPHNLYLHSGLVRTRKVNRRCHKSVRTANNYFFIESAIALLCAFIVNLFGVSIFASLYKKTNADVRQICLDHHEYNYAEQFSNTSDVLSSDDVDLYKGGIYLGCMLGNMGLYIWAIGLLVDGQSSTMIGSYAGQFVMEGFVNIRWARWKRVLFTRSVAIVPAFSIALFQDIQHLTGVNQLLNALRLIQLPFGLLPCLTFTSSERVMKDFKNGIFVRIFLSVVALLIIVINLIFVFHYIHAVAGDSYIVWIVAGIFMFLYLLYVFYLMVYCAAALFGKEDRLTCPLIQTLFRMKENIEASTSDSNGSTDDLDHMPSWLVFRQSR